MKNALLFLVLVVIGAPSVYAAAMPAHAHARLFEPGWECDEGFYHADGKCVPLVVPAHARPDLTGNAWECEPGYVRAGDACALMNIPADAQIDPFGKGWNCNRGYYRDGERCVPVDVPADAVLNAEGDDWECAAAFKRVDGVCVAMTAEEVAERARQYEESARNAFTRVGPETGLCQIGYNKCTSACSGGVLAPAAGKKVKSAAFTSACMMACDSGRQACASSSGVCDAFDSACSTDCPEEAFDSDNGAALSAADGHGVCARACQLGGRWCQDQRRKMPTAKGNP